MSEKGTKRRFFTPEEEITLTKEKEQRKRRSEEDEKQEETGEKKKQWVALLVFIMPTLEIVFGRKKNHCLTKEVHLAVIGFQKSG